MAYNGFESCQEHWECFHRYGVVIPDNLKVRRPSVRLGMWVDILPKAFEAHIYTNNENRKIKAKK